MNNQQNIDERNIEHIKNTINTENLTDDELRVIYDELNKIWYKNVRHPSWIDFKTVIIEINDIKNSNDNLILIDFKIKLRLKSYPEQTIYEYTFINEKYEIIIFMNNQQNIKHIKNTINTENLTDDELRVIYNKLNKIWYKNVRHPSWIDFKTVIIEINDIKKNSNDNLILILIDLKIKLRLESYPEQTFYEYTFINEKDEIIIFN